MLQEKEKFFWKTIEQGLLFFFEKQVFSAASLSISDPSTSIFTSSGIGVGCSDNKSEPITDKTIFDLASLTKPLVTLPCILHLLEKKRISWDEPLSSLLEKDVPEALGLMDLQCLLAHNSGLAAHRDYWKKLIELEDSEKKAWLLHRLLAEKPEYEKGSRHQYSDLGYMLLGFVVEVKTGEPLARYWKKEVADPLGLGEQLFFPDAGPGADGAEVFFVPTGSCRWSGVSLQGRVHDDNCRALGGSCGHAGLFGSSFGVLELCRQYLLLYHGRENGLPFSSENFRYACSRVGDSEWTRGFNLVSKKGSSSGAFFSDSSIGHLGFTGVSFWIDLQKELIVVLLTNRVAKGEDREPIQRMRIDMHNKVVELLRKYPPEQHKEQLVPEGKAVTTSK